MSDLVVNPEDRFSHDTAYVNSVDQDGSVQKHFYQKYMSNETINQAPDFGNGRTHLIMMGESTFQRREKTLIIIISILKPGFPLPKMGLV